MSESITQKNLQFDTDQNVNLVARKKPDKKIQEKPVPKIQATEIGFVIALPITLGALFGLWLDNKFATHPRLMLSGLFTGVFLSFSNLFMIVKQFSNKDKK